MSEQVNESQFFMWRAIFALAHADDVVTKEELRFMSEALEDVPFSDEQKATLKADTLEAQSVELMFMQITDPLDQSEFFQIASKMVHADGDFGQEEQDVMLKIKRIHLANVDVDKLVGHVDLKFDEDNLTDEDADFKGVVHSARNKFLERLFGSKK